MKIEITRAIEHRLAEIKRLQTMRPIIQSLIDDAKAAETGKPCMSAKDFNERKEVVENELFYLGLARRVGKNENGIGGSVGLPTHWSMAEVE